MGVYQKTMKTDSLEVSGNKRYVRNLFIKKARMKNDLYRTQREGKKVKDKPIKFTGIISEN